MEPNKRYTQTVEKPFHVSHAALDTSTGDNDICQVMIVADKKNFLICTLQKGKIVQCPLNHYFKSGEVISFLTNGKCNVHLTGYLDPDIESESEFGSEDEEAPTLVPIESKREKKRKLDTSGGEVAASKKLKKEASKVLNGQSDSDSDSDEQSVVELAKLLGEDVDSDENDESFNPSTLNDTAESEDDEEYDSDELRRREEEGSSSGEEEEAEEEEDESEKEELVQPKKLSRAEKRKLKKQQKKQAQQPEKATPQQQQTQQNGVEKKKAKKEQQQQQQKGKEQKAKEQNGQQETKPSPVQREKKTLSGGVFVEDLKVGTGPAAKAGKVVQVYYEGRLKQNNKMFDNCNKGPGFKFRLGSKEVISGWDVGVAGMKVGGKRKIVCPPTMAYGQSGSPPVIPPNSTLVFEVELKNVK